LWMLVQPGLPFLQLALGWGWDGLGCVRRIRRARAL
jgi:hypothetical protein